MPDYIAPIIPFSEAGSSNPAEKGLHPSTIQRILEAIAAVSSGFGGGMQGNPMAGAQIAQSFQNQRLQNVQNQILGQIIGQGAQLGQTPQDVQMNIPSINLGGMGQTLPASPSAPNPAYQQLIDKILQGSQQFAQLGGDPNQLVNALTKTGVMRDPILDRQSKMAEQKHNLDMEKEKFKQGQINQRAKEKNIVAGRLANSLIEYRQGGTPQQAKNVLMDLNQQYRLELNDYYDALKDFPILQAYNPNLPPPVMPTLEGVAANAGYDLEELKRKVGGGGKKTAPPPAIGDPKKKQNVMNQLWAKFQKANKKWLNQKDYELYQELKKQGFSPQ